MPKGRCNIRSTGRLATAFAACGALAWLTACRNAASADLIAEFVANVGSNATRIGAAPGRPDELFVSRLNGELMRIDLAASNAVTMFADVSNVQTDGMKGFLGFAFHPEFQANGALFVHVADDLNAAPGVDHRTYVRRFDLPAPQADVATLGAPTTIIRYDQPGLDHDGGFLGFRPGEPDVLYVTSGDGVNSGSNNDPFNHGQNTFTPLGAVLRLDVSGDDFPADPHRNFKVPADNPFADGAGGDPAVWLYGVRNPHGASFDRQTGDFIFGDVGQVNREEVNFVRADAAGGLNFGWRVMEGTRCNNNTQSDGNLPCNDPSFVPPVYEYGRSGGYGVPNAAEFEGRSVTGGYVYRGPLETLQGQYVFADWSSQQVWSLEIDREANGGLGAVVPGSLTNLSDALGRKWRGDGTPFNDGITSFGEDAAGNLYFVELDGDVYRISEGTAPPPPPPGPGDRPGVALRDDFAAPHSYLGGAVPAAGVWDGVYNPTAGGGPFDAAVAAAGQLSLGTSGVGWEGGGRDDARFLYREVPAQDFQAIEVKISAQTTGFWSSGGVMVRVPGPIDGNGANDNFITAGSFRPGGNFEGSGFAAQLANVAGGAEGEANFGVGSAADLNFLRLVNDGNGRFTLFTSADGEAWVERGSTTNASLAAAETWEVGLWGGAFGTLADAVIRFDEAIVSVAIESADFNQDGSTDGADLLTWQRGFGALGAAALFAAGNANGDAAIDELDFALWQSEFGRDAQASQTIPEATALALSLAAGCATLVRPRRRDVFSSSNPLVGRSPRVVR